MQVRLLVDTEGPNPDFCPPNPATDPGGFHAYSVPHTIIVPAGTLLPEDERGFDWVLCFPQSADYIDVKTKKPVRRDDLILAEPVDDEAKAAVAKHLVGWSRDRRLTIEKGAALLAKMVAESKAWQEKNVAAASKKTV